MLDLFARANIVDIRRSSGAGSEVECVLVARHLRAIAESEDAQLARLTANGVGVFQFDLIAVVLEDAGIELLLIGLFWLDETAGAHRPVVVIPLKRDTRRVSARICGVVVCPVGHQRPVEKLGAWFVAVGVVVEDIEHGQVSDGQYPSALVHFASKLIGVRFDHFLFAAHAPGLAQEQTRAVHLEPGTSCALYLSIGETAQARKPRKRDTLRSLGVNVEPAARPWPKTQRSGGSEGVASLLVGREAVGT